MNDTKPKLIFLDLDGTLLNDDHRLTESTIKSIHRIGAEFELKFVLASGRAPQAMIPLYHALNLTTPLVALNGALVIKYPPQQRYLLNETLSLSAIAAIQKASASRTASLNYYCQNDWFCQNKNEYVLIEEWINKTEAVNKSKKLNALWVAGERLPNKVEIFSDQKELNRVELILRKMFQENLTILRSTENCLEIHPFLSNKAAGARAVMEHFKIIREEVWAFGDAQNDHEILEMAHRGIVMKNSKYIDSMNHDEVTPYSNNEDGVVRYLEKYIKI